MRQVQQTMDHLFRSEYGKMVSHLTRALGTAHLELAEEAMSEAMCRAVEVWPIKGTPKNPAGWLVRVAKNHALDQLRRASNFRTKTDAVTWLTESLHAMNDHESDRDEVIRDDQLRMMFSCCHPALATNVQIAVMLKLLCAFSVAEIASAFLVSVPAIEKRISRGKRSLVEAKTLMALGPDAVAERLDGVCQALYLLFNEGYLSGGNEGIRETLCFEAMRLTAMLLSTPNANRPAVHALFALMCFHSARLPARRDDSGNLVLLMDQDRTKWDTGLIRAGFEAIQASDPAGHLTHFHVQALLSAKHLLAPRPEDTDWVGMLELYDKLLALKPSPVVRVNRAIVIGRLKGPLAALALLLDESAEKSLRSYHYYHASVGQMYAESGQTEAAMAAWERAADHCRNALEVQCIRQKIAAL